MHYCFYNYGILHVRKCSTVHVAMFSRAFLGGENGSRIIRL